VNTVSEKELSLQDFVNILRRRRNVFLATFAAVVALSLLACIFMTRRYEAKGVIQLQKPSSENLDLGDLMGSALGGGGDSLTQNIELQTQASILQSDTLALQVIQELNLEQNADFKSKFSIIRAALRLISPSGPGDPAGASLENSPRRRAHALKVFQDHLKVKVTSGTRLIEVSYTNPDPKVASAVVNHLVQALIDFTFQTKYKATSQISDWLTGQLGDLRKQSEDLASRVVAMQKETGLFGVGASDLQGKPIIYSPVLDRLQTSTAQLSQAQLNEVVKESVYKIVKTGDPELISELSGTSLAGSSSMGVTTSLDLIHQLRAQEATIEAQLAQDSSVYGPQYPKLIEEKASLAKVRQSLHDEIARISERAKNDAEVARSTLEGAQRAYNADRAAAEKLNDKAIEYAILEREANQSEELYQDLLKRLKEAGILEGLHSSNVTIVDKASPPSDPSSPKVLLILPAGVVGGFILGIFAAFFSEASDNKIQGIEEIEAMGLRLLGILPHSSASEHGEALFKQDSRFSAYHEAVRSLRSSILISRSGRPPQVILITSPSPGEGKSTTALGLSIVMAQYGRKVLLVEADMRRPVYRTRLKLDPAAGGLSLLLADAQAEFKPILLNPELLGLHVLAAGPTPPYPSELIGSDQMRRLVESWRSMYDFILIDCPPVLPVTDAQILEELVDATILLARVGATSRIALERGYKTLLQHAKDQTNPNLGVVLNFVSSRSAAYYGYYGYYGGGKYDYRQEGNDANR
jgi:succinoglycan biosynthesis transport protein ExoP